MFIAIGVRMSLHCVQVPTCPDNADSVMQYAKFVVTELMTFTHNETSGRSFISCECQFYVLQLQYSYNTYERFRFSEHSDCLVNLTSSSNCKT